MKTIVTAQQRLISIRKSMRKIIRGGKIPDNALETLMLVKVILDICNVESIEGQKTADEIIEILEKNIEITIKHTREYKCTKNT